MTFYNPTVNGPMPQAYLVDPKTMFPDWRDYSSVSNGYDACQPKDPKPMPYYPPPGNYINPKVPIHNPNNDPRRIGMDYVPGPKYMPVDQNPTNPYYPKEASNNGVNNQTSAYVPTEYKATSALEAFEEKQAAQKITPMEAFEEHFENKKSTGKKIWENFNKAVAKVKYYTAFSDGDSDAFSKEDFIMEPTIIKVGSKSLANKRIFVENGINTSPKKFRKMCQKISSSLGGIEVYGIYNPDYGTIEKLEEAVILNTLGDITTTSGVFTAYTTGEYLAQDANNEILIIPHSNGTAHAKHGLKLIPEDMHQRIEVLAVAPSSYITDVESLKEAGHIAGKWDFIRHLDWEGKNKSKGNCEVINNGFGLQAHAFDNSDFQEKIEERIRGFIHDNKIF